MRKFRVALVFLLLTGLAVGPAAVLAQDITVTGSPRTGVLPWMITAFAQPADDVLPAGATDWYVFTLFDTGSTRVAFDLGYAGALGVYHGMLADVRINGLGAIDPGTLLAPIYPEQSPQAEVLNVFLSVPTTNPVNRTLIGGPVTNFVKAVIDYTMTVTRGPYEIVEGGYISGPDIRFYQGDEIPGGYTPAVTLALKPYGDPDEGEGNCYYVYNVGFNQGTASVASPASGDIAEPQRFLYDTGTRPTLIRQPIADILGLDLDAWDFQEMVNGIMLPGFYLDSITMTGEGGTYTVVEAPVVVTTSALYGSADAIIGSNLFSRAKLLFNGPAATLGINVPGAPVANAGTDQVIEGTGPTTSFTLSGSGSDPNGDALTYSWKDDDGNVVGDTATVDLSGVLKTYIFTLTVTDPSGLGSSDSVSITIQDTTPPTLVPPADREVAESDPILGTFVDLGSPTEVSDLCDSSPAVDNNAPEPPLFPLGETIVTWTATDASGNTSRAYQKVTVVPGTPLNQLDNLVKLIDYSVASGGVYPEMQTSLLAKINAAIAALVQGNSNASKVALNDLKALVNQVEAQTDKKITPPVAAEIIRRANQVIQDLGG